MANRTVYGHTHSENNWPMVDRGSCVWVKVPGTQVTLQIREGQPAKIMGAFAADFNAYIEPLRDHDSACWTETNSVASSNHLSGTGMDLNWNGSDNKTFRYGIPKHVAYPGDKARKLDELLAFYEGMIFCGGEWSIRDWMHYQMGANTYGAQHVHKVNDFIARKIRPDGFSTFGRGGAPAMPVAVSPVEILARATGLSVDRCRPLLQPLSDGLKAAECTTVNRIAMYLAQVGHESDGFNATEEYASGDAYDTRTDLGNTPQVDGDGRLYKGRSWIQITGKHNYREFSLWACAKGLVPTPDFFVVHPLELSDLRWAGIGAAWYWTVARSDINALSDRRDLETVTRRINGGLNGLDDRRNRYNRALAVGDQLLTLLTGGDDLASVPQDQWDRALFLLEQIAGIRRQSLSPLRHLGEGPSNTAVGYAWAADGLTHPQFVLMAAKAGHVDSIDLLREVASADLARYPDRADDKELALSLLAEVERTNPEALQRYIAQKGAA